MKILVVAAHADDELLGPGATLIRHARAGDEVHVAVCIGKPNSAMYDAARYGEDVLSKRKAQAQSVVEHCGFKQLHWLDLQDETLEEENNKAIPLIEAVVAKVKPEIAYLHHGGDLNQDHRGAFQASMVAMRGLLKDPVRKILCFETPSSTEQAPPRSDWTFRPNHFVDISETLNDKIEALKLYADELSPFPHPRSPEGLEAIARTRGMVVGFKAAEAFELIRESVPATG